MHRQSVTDTGGLEEGQERDPWEEGGGSGGPSHRGQTQGPGRGRKKLPVLLSGGNLAKNGLVVGARKKNSGKTFPKLGGRVGSGRGERGAAGAGGLGS